MMMSKNSPIYLIPLQDVKPFAPVPPQTDALFCTWCWKYHPKDTIGRYDKDDNFVCSSCVLDCYAMGWLIGETWHETKARWQFRKVK